MAVRRAARSSSSRRSRPTRPIGSARRDRLDRFVLALSRALVSTPPAAIDRAVQQWLGRLVALLGADRGCITVMAGDERGARVRHYHDVADAPVLETAGPEPPFERFAERIRADPAIRAEQLSGTDAAEMAAAFGGRAGPPLESCLVLPFAVEGAAPGALAIGYARADRRWPDDLVTTLALAANVFASAIALGRAHASGEERVVFERLVTDFVTTLVSVPADRVVERLEQGLLGLMSHFGVQRAALGRFTDTGALVRVCAVSAPGVPVMGEKIDLPWYLEELRQARVVRIDEVSSGLPAAAVAEREYTAQVGIRSQLTIPLTAGERVWGGIGFAAVSHARTWTDEEVGRLGLLGEIMMRAYLRAEAEGEEHRQRDELAHVARVAALGELAAALAHELNQPLMAIRVNAQATRRVLRSGHAADVREVLGDIAADATRAGDLIARLRDLLKRREPAKAPLDLNQVVAGVQAIGRAETHRHAAELVVEAAPGLPLVFGDEVQLQQVILNLVRNAAEAMSAQVGPREVRIRTSAGPGEPVTVSVEDHGPPIDDATLAGMFTPFSSTKAGGLGIGLAISRSIAEAHAGRLWAERRADRGLAVKLSLPAHLKG